MKNTYAEAFNKQGGLNFKKIILFPILFFFGKFISQCKEYV
jgi:hypothetical protein